MIKQAKLSGIEQILIITKACGEKMVADGIFPLNETYPNFEIFQKDIERNELYVFISKKLFLAVL